MSDNSFQRDQVHNLFDGQVSTCGSLIAPSGIDRAYLRLSLPENHYLAAVEIQNIITDPTLISIYIEAEPPTSPYPIKTTACVVDQNFKNQPYFNCTQREPATFVLLEANVNHIQMCGDIVLYGDGEFSILYNLSFIFSLLKFTLYIVLLRINTPGDY